MSQGFKETEIGRIPEEWSIKTLDEISLKLTDGSHFSPKEILNSKNIICTVKDMEYNNFSFESAKFISDKDFEELVKNGCSPKKGDILISKDGANCLDLIFVYTQDKEIVLLSSIAIVRIVDNFNPFFYRYYLLSPLAQKMMKNGYISGSAIPRVVLKDFKRLPVPVPSIEEQNNVAQILSDLDSKIELNQRMNQNLEEIGRAIFKHWFVDFEFPDEQGRPYKSSGGEMVNSELGEIPKGWEVKKINDVDIVVTDYVANGSFASLKENVKILDTKNYALFVRNTDLKDDFASTRKYVDEHAYDFLSKTKLFGGELIISNVGDVGSVFLCPFFKFPMTLGNNIIMLKSNGLNNFFYYLFTSYYGQELIKSITSGSVQLKFNKTDFRNLEIIIPNSQTLKKFDSIVTNLNKKIFDNKFEIEKLSEIRDSILPKLMSGKIRVLSKW